MTRKSVLRSVRLDDDVWEAVKAMPVSLNQYLRGALIEGLMVPPGLADNPAFQRGLEEGKARKARRELRPKGDKTR